MTSSWPHDPARVQETIETECTDDIWELHITQWETLLPRSDKIIGASSHFLLDIHNSNPPGKFISLPSGSFTSKHLVLMLKIISLFSQSHGACFPVVNDEKIVLTFHTKILPSRQQPLTVCCEGRYNFSSNLGPRGLCPQQLTDE